MTDPADRLRADLPALLPRLWRYGLLLCGSRDGAEDLVQAACLRAIERAHQFRPDSRLDHWLFSILRSIWFNEARSRRIRRGAGVFDASEALTFDGAELMATNISAAQVLKAVGRLPQAQREAVMLVYVEGCSYREAADLCEVPIGTIMSRLAAARAALARFRGE